MKLPEGDRLQDAVDLWHDNSWSCPGGRPLVSSEQLAHALVVLEPWFRQEFAPTRGERPKQKVQNRPPKPKADRGSQALGRKLVYARSGGSCEAWIGGVCIGMAREWHHRLNRSQGGRWDASNGMHLCGPCHDYITNRNRALAKENGWAVAPGMTPPAEVPALRRGRLVLLHDDGSYEPYEEVA